VRPGEQQGADSIPRVSAEQPPYQDTGHTDVCEHVSVGANADEPIASEGRNQARRNKLDKGGHFAAWEQPKLFSEEMRVSFRTLRQVTGLVEIR